MKNKLVMLMVLSLVAAGAAFGQSENDDMYFTSKDRNKLVSARQVTYTNIPETEDIEATGVASIAATDSYSGKDENPEYANSGTAKEQTQYFTTSYQPVGLNQGIAANGSPYYGNSSNYYGMNSMYNSPYNSGFGSGYAYNGGMGYGMGYPYSSMGMGMGSGMGYGSMYGMGMGYGMGYSSMYGMGMGYNSMYGMGYGMGYPYGGMYGMSGMGYGSYYSGGAYVVVDNSRVNYGQRGSRNNAVGNSYYNRHSSSNGRPVVNGGNRMASNNQNIPSQYYSRGWRNSSASTGNGNLGSGSRSSFTSGSGNSTGGSRSSSSWTGGGTRSSWTGGSNGTSSGSSFGGSRSSGFSGGSGVSGGTRSSGFSGGSSSGGGGFSGGGGGGSRGRH